MEFKDIKRAAIDYLKKGTFDHEARSDINVKNLFSIDIVDIGYVISFINKRYLMRIVKEGGKRQVVCHSCGRSEVTYLLRDVDFSDKCGTVKNILAAACDKCHEVVSIPAQSTPKIKTEYNRIKTSVEVRVPAHFLDILNVVIQKINPELYDKFNRALILYYIHP